MAGNQNMVLAGIKADGTIVTSTGVPDANKLVKTDSNGKLSDTVVPVVEVFGTASSDITEVSEKWFVTKDGTDNLVVVEDFFDNEKPVLKLSVSSVASTPQDVEVYSQAILPNRFDAFQTTAATLLWKQSAAGFFVTGSIIWVGNGEIKSVTSNYTEFNSGGVDFGRINISEADTADTTNFPPDGPAWASGEAIAYKVKFTLSPGQEVFLHEARTFFTITNFVDF